MPLTPSKTDIILQISTFAPNLKLKSSATRDELLDILEDLEEQRAKRQREDALRALTTMRAPPEVARDYGYDFLVQMGQALANNLGPLRNLVEDVLAIKQAYERYLFMKSKLGQALEPATQWHSDTLLWQRYKQADKVTHADVDRALDDVFVYIRMAHVEQAHTPQSSDIEHEVKRQKTLWETTQARRAAEKLKRRDVEEID